MAWRVCIRVSLVVLVASGVRAEEVLTLPDALARARAAPAARSAALQVEEARGRLRTAELRPNPVLEASAGPEEAEGQGPELDLGLSQDLQVGGRRDAHLASATADLARATAAADGVLRDLLGRVAEAFVHARHGDEAVRLAGEVETLLRQVADATERRHQLGDVADLEVNLARAALARAASDRAAAEAHRTQDLAELKQLLGIPASESVRLTGDLLPPAPPDMSALLQAARARPDLRVREAEQAEAGAALRLAQAERRPDLGLLARYEREEGDGTLFAGVRLTLPIANRGQGLEQEARARQQRLTAEQGAALQAVEVEVEGARAAYTEARAAAAVLQEGALSLLEETERLSARSYEAGQIGLAEYLLVRRELSETRALYLERLLEAALAWVRLQTRTGGLP
ncbi:MAG TPA: TolC family protein, partial [Candidatus Polarisedimenticolaceae bacterium]|nr:TolC family protein [Candidatus Polarisedimenticolaceae bacterium]